jgi:hypothetical protein
VVGISLPRGTGDRRVVQWVLAGLRRKEPNPRSVSKQQNTAEVIAQRRDAKRHPELVHDDVQYERNGERDAAVPRASCASTTSVREIAAAAQGDTGFHARDVRVGRYPIPCRLRLSGRALRERISGIRKKTEELTECRFSVDTDRFRVGADERAAKQPYRPLRCIVAFERLEQRRFDLGPSGDVSQRDLLEFPLSAQTRAEAVGHCRSSPWCCCSHCRLTLMSLRSPAVKGRLAVRQMTMLANTVAMSTAITAIVLTIMGPRERTATTGAVAKD